MGLCSFSGHNNAPETFVPPITIQNDKINNTTEKVEVNDDAKELISNGMGIQLLLLLELSYLQMV